MFVIVDIDTLEELGPASYEMVSRWAGSSAPFLEMNISCAKRRVIVRKKNDGRLADVKRG